MKKLLLLLVLFCTSPLLFSQTFNQPSQFNNVCDDNNDGFASFYLEEISLEILSGLNPVNYVVTHHETLSDAIAGTSPLSSPYLNVTPFNQIIYVRIVNLLTNEVQTTSYLLTVNQAPQAQPQVLTNCSTTATVPQCWNLDSLIPNIIGTNPSANLTFHETMTDAQFGSNPIFNTNCYISPIIGSSMLYFRNTNLATSCFSVGIVELILVNCNQAGYPQNLTQCVDSGVACFDLTVNNGNVIGSLNPSDYTITYHVSQADANNGLNPLSSPYCMTSAGSQTLFVRLENNTTLEFTVNPFTISTQMVSPNVVVLNDMNQCDENGDGTVTFNLTNIQAQISSTNPLQYYGSLANAMNQVVPFTNPSALNIAATILNTPIFVREIVTGSCDIIYSFNAKAYAVCNLAYVCNQANSLCSALGVPFSNTVNSPSLGNVSCLGSTPNPTWFYLPISTAGNINLMIQQSTDINFSINNLDVDYVVFGPFTDPVSPCANGIPALSSVVSCSYSSASVENPFIPNALPGQYYLIMVTNFSNTPGYIKITQTSGSTGTINCSGMILNAFLDSNSNGIKDTGESNFPLGQFNYEVNNNGIVHNIISPTGLYNIYEINPLNSYDFNYTIDSAYASMYNLTTASYSNVSIVVGAGMITYNFPITVTTPYNDLAVAIVPVNAPQQDFNTQIS